MTESAVLQTRNARLFAVARAEKATKPKTRSLIKQMLKDNATRELLDVILRAEFDGFQTRFRHFRYIDGTIHSPNAISYQCPMILLIVSETIAAEVQNSTFSTPHSSSSVEFRTT